MKPMRFFVQSFKFALSSPARMVGSIIWVVYLLPALWVSLYQMQYWVLDRFSLVPQPFHLALPFMGNIADIYNEPYKGVCLFVVLVLIWVGAILVYSRNLKGPH